LASEASRALALGRLAQVRGGSGPLAWSLLEEVAEFSGADAAALVFLKEIRSGTCLIQWREGIHVPEIPVHGPRWGRLSGWEGATSGAEECAATLAEWNYSARSTVSRPVCAGDEVLAVLRLYDFGKGASPMCEPPAELIHLAARLLESDLNRLKLDRENRALRALASRAMPAAPQTDEAVVARQTLALAIELGGFDRGVLLMARDGLMVPRAMQGIDALAQAALEACPLDPARSPGLMALAEGGGLSPRQLQSHPGLGPCFNPNLPRFHCRAILEGGDLLKGYGLFGLLLVGGEGEGRTFDDSLFDTVCYLLLEQASHALRTSRLIAELEGSRRRLEETTQTLVQAERLAAIGRMAAAVAHHVRNPLSVIAATTEMMAERLGAEHPLAGDLAVLASKVSDTEAIVRELMQLGRPLQVRLQKADVAPLLSAVAAFLKAKAEALGITICLRLEPPDEPPWLDTALLERCLLDLALNALQATKSGGTVELGYGASMLEGAVEVWVEDDGAGLGGQDRSKLFEPFVSSRAGGTGLGLYNVRRHCHAMGAQVHAEDRRDGRTGARFTILLNSGRQAPWPRSEPA
jgi:signal transduction histidine kinase